MVKVLEKVRRQIKLVFKIDNVLEFGNRSLISQSFNNFILVFWIIAVQHYRVNMLRLPMDQVHQCLSQHMFYVLNYVLINRLMGYGAVVEGPIRSQVDQGSEKLDPLYQLFKWHRFLEF